MAYRKRSEVLDFQGINEIADTLKSLKYRCGESCVEEWDDLFDDMASVIRSHASLNFDEGTFENRAGA